MELERLLAIGEMLVPVVIGVVAGTIRLQPR